MASPFIQYDKLDTLASIGGYSVITALDNLSAVFLLSACVVMRQRWLWESPLYKISDSEYQNILAMIETTEYELMTTFVVGQVISTVNDISSLPNVLMLDGSIVTQSDYPELYDAVPATWISGTDIQLPNMTNTGLFGNNGANVGDIIGENDVTLTATEMPSHNHSQNPHSHSEVIPVVTPTLGGEIPATASLVVATPSSTGIATATNNPTGGDGSHNNIQQSLSVYYWIIAW